MSLIPDADPEADPDAEAETVTLHATAPPQHPLRCPDTCSRRSARTRVCAVILFWLGALLAAGVGMVATRRTTPPPRSYTSNEVYTLVVTADDAVATTRVKDLVARFGGCPRVATKGVKVAYELR